MGGAAKAAMQSVKSAPKTGPAPQIPPRGQQANMPPPRGMPPQSMPPRGMPPALAPNPGRPGSVNPGMPPPAGPGQMQLQFMSDKLRGAAAGMPPPAGPVKMQGLGQAMGGNPQMAQNLGKVAGAAMGGMGMKSGGTASSRADGCATKGKTKGRFV